MPQTVASQIHEHLDRMPPEQQRQVLSYVRSLTVARRGVTGQSLLRFSGVIPPDDIAIITNTIKERMSF